jgi:hypothetical protein
VSKGKTFKASSHREAMIVLLSFAVRRHLYRNRADYDSHNISRNFNVCSALAGAHEALLQCCEDKETTANLDAAFRDLESTISNRLGDFCYVHDWLRKKVTGGKWTLGDEFSSGRPKVIKYRRDWMHDMIRTLKNGGDL